MKLTMRPTIVATLASFPWTRSALIAMLYVPYGLAREWIKDRRKTKP